jgi:hypothetical protein
MTILNQPFKQDPDGEQLGDTLLLEDHLGLPLTGAVRACSLRLSQSPDVRSLARYIKF